MMSSYIDNLGMFFNTKPQLESALSTVNKLNKTAKIGTNQTKSEYVAMNWKDTTLLQTNNKIIHPVNKKKNIRQLGSYLDTKSFLKKSSIQYNKTLSN
jgi:hypothetical protein